MSTLGGGNGDSWPPEGGGQPDRPSEGNGKPDGLSGLPAEWGTIVIPDDPAELAQESATLRRELRRDARRATWRRRLGLPARSGADPPSSLGLPLLIMSIAVVATLTSLFVVAWPHRVNESADGTHASAPAGAGPSVSALAGRPLPDLSLPDTTGATVRLSQLAPAAVLLVESCDCMKLINDTVASAPETVSILLVSHTPISALPSPAPSATGPPALPQVINLLDPGNRLHAALGLPDIPGSATVVLVSRAGRIVSALTGVEALAAFASPLAGLA